MYTMFLASSRVAQRPAAAAPVAPAARTVLRRSALQMRTPHRWQSTRQGRRGTVRPHTVSSTATEVPRTSHCDLERFAGDVVRAMEEIHMESWLCDDIVCPAAITRDWEVMRCLDSWKDDTDAFFCLDGDEDFMCVYTEHDLAGRVAVGEDTGCSGNADIGDSDAGFVCLDGDEDFVCMYGEQDLAAAT